MACNAVQALSLRSIARLGPLGILALAAGCTPIPMQPFGAGRSASRQTTPRQVVLAQCDRGDLEACERSAYAKAYGRTPDARELAAVRPRDVCARADAPACQDAERILARAVGGDSLVPRLPPGGLPNVSDAVEIKDAENDSDTKADLRARRSAPAAKP